MPVLYKTHPEWNQFDNPRHIGMTRMGHLIALWLRTRELAGTEWATREQMLETLPASERSIDGGLAWLNKKGLLIKAKSAD